MKRTTIALLVASVLNTANAAPQVAGPGAEIVVNRYTKMKVAPTAAQEKLLSVIVDLNFPEQVITVGEAINYALSRSGYTLEPSELTSAGMQLLLAQKLPKVHQKIGPVMLKDALQALAGVAYEMKSNDLLRTVTFKVRDSYKEQLAEAMSVTPQMNVSNDVPNYTQPWNDTYQGGRFIKTANTESTAAISADAAANATVPEAVVPSDIEQNEMFDGTEMQVVDIKKDPIVIPPSPFADFRKTTQQTVIANNKYGPVQPKEILWDIADKYKSGQNYSVPQVMAAILELNPDAFKDGNMHHLYDGVMLTIPTEEEIKKFNQREALALTVTQYESFKVEQEETNN